MLNKPFSFFRPGFRDNIDQIFLGNAPFYDLFKVLGKIYVTLGDFFYISDNQRIK